MVRPPIADVQGPRGAFVNGGDIENKVLNMALRWTDNIGGLTYGAQLTTSQKTKTRLPKLGDNSGFIQSNGSIISQGTDPVWRVEVGYPVGYFHGYKPREFFQNAQQIAHGTWFSTKHPSTR